MDVITNDKIVDMSPRWAAFRGVSLLFDNPTYRSALRREHIGRLSVRIAANKRLALYRALSDALDEIGREVLARVFALCALPSSTYHVTVWNGVNDANVAGSPASKLPILRSMLRQLPDSLGRPHPLWDTLSATPLLTRTGWAIDFSFDRLVVWHNRVLVARLRPANSSSQALLAELATARTALSAVVRRRFGIETAQPRSPHVTLGYYANKDCAARSLGEIDAWNAIAGRHAASRTVTFESVGLYAFTDMVSFFRRPTQATTRTTSHPPKRPRV